MLFLYLLGLQFEIKILVELFHGRGRIWEVLSTFMKSVVWVMQRENLSGIIIITIEKFSSIVRSLNPLVNMECELCGVTASC